eukprot:5195633-Alexandrium_andersonii.AAC.1
MPAKTLGPYVHVAVVRCVASRCAPRRDPAAEECAWSIMEQRVPDRSRALLRAMGGRRPSARKSAPRGQSLLSWSCARAGGR